MDLDAQLDKACQLHGAGRLDEAQALYHAVLKAQPRHAFAQSQLALVFLQRGKTEQGLRGTEKALRLDPNQPYALNNRGVALYTLGRYEEAIASYDRTIALLADFAEAHCNRGQALIPLGRLPEALASLDHALRLEPAHARTLEIRALALVQIGRLSEAVLSAERAIGLNPALHEAHVNRGNALYLLSRPGDALAAYERAIALAPHLGAAHAMRANVLRDLGRLDEALASDDAALACGGEIEYAPGARLMGKMAMCDWAGFEQDQRKLLALIDRGKPASTPFCLMGLHVTPAQQLKVAKQFAARKSVVGARQGRAPFSHDRIRIGYFSSDFYNHATALLMAGMIEAHDRARFEIIGFSFGDPRMDSVRDRLERGFDQFIDVNTQSDEAVAALARRMEIDIAVDLKGDTANARTGIFAHGAAPVQVSFLGYPGTMGADFIDYLIADPVLIQPDQQQFYAEKIAYLPDSYQVNDSKREPPVRQFTRAALGLPETGFVFCSFNNNYKITPDVFDIWMRLVKSVEGSVLWLFEANRWAGANLRAEAEKRGVAAERLVFAPRMDLADHLSRHAHADLFLDTFYCTAHTTASDALWAGVPVLTRLGETFTARVAASLLTAVGLSELIAADATAYEAMALDLAQSPSKLSALKAKLADVRLTAPLFDTQRFTSHIERAYEEMQRRVRAGERPDHIWIQPEGRA